MTDRTIATVQAGLVPYREALGWQRRLAQARILHRLPHDVLLLLEHPPVITLGRGAQPEHLLASGDIELAEVERGGDVTYHGPGQLVGYPILDLRGGGYRTDLHWYLRTLEEALIRGLQQLDIWADRRQGLTGVWTKGRKIASIGVHVKQWVTWHGFALNITTDLAAFDRIVPCGIEGVRMTSVAEELGVGSGRRAGARLWEECVEAVLHGFEEAFDVTAEAASTASTSIVEACRQDDALLSATPLNVLP
jgi:lipoyl(octanoyl) transferase